MNISIDQAKAFCSTVDQGGYTQAAQTLNKSHPALIYLIKTLEQQCGFELFNRKAYRNTLTASGRRVYLKCLEILAKVDELNLLCGQFNQGWEAHLKIIYDGILPFEPFLLLYKKFKSEKIPTIIQTYTDYLDDVEKNFNQLQADIMITILPIENKNLKPVYLKPKKMFLVTHKEHPLAKKNKKWTSSEMDEFDFLTIRGSGPKLGLNTDEFEKSASFFLSDFSAKKEAILKKTGFGWLPEHLIEKELAAKTLLPIKWQRESLHVIQPILYMNNNKNVGPASTIILELLENM
jgi:DNA-binding transcriptional LysR family regulator